MLSTAVQTSPLTFTTKETPKQANRQTKPNKTKPKTAKKHHTQKKPLQQVKQVRHSSHGTSETGAMRHLSQASCAASRASNAAKEPFHGADRNRGSGVLAQQQLIRPSRAFRSPQNRQRNRINYGLQEHQVIQNALVRVLVKLVVTSYN